MKAKQTARHIPLTALVPHPDNPPERIEPESVMELSFSIREHGILQPLVVTEHLTEPDRWTILAGHRRWAGAKLAGLTHAPCVIRHGLDEDADEQNIVMLVENCQRKDLEPMTRAEMLDSLRSRGLTLAQIAHRTGLSESRISESLMLLDLDEETRQKVRDGEVRVGQATQAVRVVRAAIRTGTPVGRQTKTSYRVRVDPQHFTRRHPLAADVRDLCDHSTRPKVGGVGCGQCWEQVIRQDALAGRGKT